MGGTSGTPHQQQPTMTMEIGSIMNKNITKYLPLPHKWVAIDSLPPNVYDLDVRYWNAFESGVQYGKFDKLKRSSDPTLHGELVLYLWLEVVYIPERRESITRQHFGVSIGDTDMSGRLTRGATYKSIVFHHTDGKKTTIKVDSPEAKVKPNLDTKWLARVAPRSVFAPGIPDRNAFYHRRNDVATSNVQSAKFDQCTHVHASMLDRVTSLSQLIGFPDDDSEYLYTVISSSTTGSLVVLTKEWKPIFWNLPHIGIVHGTPPKFIAQLSDLT